MSDPTDMEALAAVEHESWAGWTRWMLTTLELELGESTLSPQVLEVLRSLPCVQRWRRQMDAPYDALSDKEKESDRAVVRKKLAAYRGCAQAPAVSAVRIQIAVAVDQKGRAYAIGWLDSKSDMTDMYDQALENLLTSFEDVAETRVATVIADVPLPDRVEVRGRVE